MLHHALHACLRRPMMTIGSVVAAAVGQGTRHLVNSRSFVIPAKGWFAAGRMTMAGGDRIERKLIARNRVIGEDRGSNPEFDLRAALA